ncbi:MAG: PD-(D/E)XK nuclease family protein [Gammaproteobacteria bacterium]
MPIGFEPAGGPFTVVTATRRLARALRAREDRQNLARGQRAWWPTDVLPWDAWVERQWRRARDQGHPVCDRKLIGAEQERVVWEQIIRDLPGPLPNMDSLLLPAQAAREAMQAWKLTRDYAITDSVLARDAGSDTRQFMLIAERFAALRRERGWAMSADLAWQLATTLDSPGDAPGHILLAGFDRYTAAQHHLIRALRNAGHQVAEWQPEAAPADAKIACCPDPDAEIRAAAAWARRFIETRPDAVVGLVLIDLEQRRSEVVDALDDALDPAAVLPYADTGARPWNLSLGLPLARWPVVDNALLALSLWLDRGSHTDVGRLLRSPYLGGGIAEADARAQLDIWLRQQGVFQLDLAGLCRLTREGSDRRRPAVPGLHTRVASLENMDPDPMRSFDDWAEQFRRVLEELGWPGDRSLDSNEFQTVAKWQELLASLAGLTAVSGRVSARAALDQLRRLATDNLFQAEAPPAPVQVLGLQETPGLSFDALWVGGLHDQAWPRPLRPNGLLPIALQREAGMPRCCARSELDYAAQRTATLTRAAGQVVFGWPARDQDETLRPAALIADLPAMTLAPAPRGLAQIIRDSADLERVGDTRMQPWPSTSPLRGGSGVLRAQAACPFQAQARFRLLAEPVETPVPGISPLMSGEIAHQALHALWQQWADPEVPRGMEPEALEQAVCDALSNAIRRALGGTRDIPPSISALEQGRLSQRILELLQQDLQRESFAVGELESQKQLELAGLTFRLRVDRVDRLASGGMLYIDYKTGKTATRDWLGERPREPQLPLYAMAGGSRVSGVAFGSLAVGEVGYRGFADSDIPGTGIRDPANGPRPVADDWSALLSVWRHQVTALADAFAQGDARVDPRRVSEDCKWCELSILCRRHELSEQGLLGDR